MKVKTINKTKAVEHRFIFLTLLYPAIMFLIFYVGLNSASFAYSFLEYDYDMNLHWAGLKNFEKAFEMIFQGESSLLGRGIINSICIFLVLNVLGIPIHMLTSYYLYKRRFGSKLIRFSAMMPSIVSGFVVSLLYIRVIEGPIPELLQKFGVIDEEIRILWDSRYNLANIYIYSFWTGFGSGLIYYPNAMNQISNEIVESATIDGASDLRILMSIMIPSIYPTLTTFMVSGVAGIMGNSGPLYLFYGYDAPPETYFSGYYVFQQTMGNKTGTAETLYPFLSAVGMIFTLISAPITLLTKWAMEKYGPSED